LKKTLNYLQNNNDNLIIFDQQANLINKKFDSNKMEIVSNILNNVNQIKKDKMTSNVFIF
jgi:hypothetical protein